MIPKKIKNKSNDAYKWTRMKLDNNGQNGKMD